MFKKTQTSKCKTWTEAAEMSLLNFQRVYLQS